MWNDPWMRMHGTHRAALVRRAHADDLKASIDEVYAETHSDWHKDANGVLCSFDPSGARPSEAMWNERYRPFLDKHAPAFFDELYRAPPPDKAQVAKAMSYLPGIAARFDPGQRLLNALEAGTLSSGLLELALPELARLHQLYGQNGEHTEVMRRMSQENLADRLIPLLFGTEAESRTVLLETLDGGWDVLRVCLGPGHLDVGIGGRFHEIPPQCRGANFLLGVSIAEEEMATLALGSDLLSMAEGWSTLELRRVWFEEEALKVLVAEGLDLDSAKDEDENERRVQGYTRKLLAEHAEKIVHFVETVRRTADDGHGLITFVDAQ